jgi:hypothetical protein
VADSTRIPDFFIVGAPKCGTTAMYGYLRQHPQIYMPFHKEPLYFGSDLTSRYGRMSEAAYVALFSSADPSQRIGEASAWYLYSERAAAEIKAFSPAADIVIMLRNPVDVMHAQHSQLLFNQQEDLHDFSEALAAEADRREGRRIPSGAVRVENLFYRRMVRFAPQVERYFDVFGRDRVHVILYEDFRDQTELTYASLLAFLGVSTTFVADFAVANPNKRVRHRWLQRIVYQPPGPLRRVIPTLRRFPIVHRVRDVVVGWNSVPAARAPMHPELRTSLIRELTPEIRDLGVLIGRDLLAWTDV